MKFLVLTLHQQLTLVLCWHCCFLGCFYPVIYASWSATRPLTLHSKVMFHQDQLFLVVLFLCVCSTGEKLFSIGLVDQLFQLPQTRLKQSKKQCMITVSCITVICIWTIHSSYRVSTENNYWKSDVFRNVNRANPNWWWIKQLIPIEHDLRHI